MHALTLVWRSFPRRAQWTDVSCKDSLPAALQQSPPILTIGEIVRGSAAHVLSPLVDGCVVEAQDCFVSVYLLPLNDAELMALMVVHVT
eukprot:scaffold8008_cov430-Prasinococcus_capsulatus_cf.AAC.3